MNILNHINWCKVAELPESELQRLLHGRGFRFPDYTHVNIDWLSPVVLIILYKEVETSWIDELSQQLLVKMTELGFVVKSIQVQYRCRDFAPTEVLYGEALTDFIATEDSLKYKINLGSKQNYGIFLDMKNGRQWVQANSRNKRVLNLFSYTCAFSNVAIAGGAQEVVNLDMSKAALAVGRDNHRLNGHDLSRVKYLGHDLFKSWGKVRRYGPFDLIIVDPPSLQKGSVNIKNDYPKIIRRLPELLSEGGKALLCLNSPDLGVNFLLEIIEAELPNAKIITKIAPPSEFTNINEDHGLKTILIVL
ncbi:class I SAM-dependent methyltransferase [Psychromonas sp. MME2]|uniref:class I SAM-dependent methyltransferase n=1 Tax=unclassified Psychromonas TaxID=2614957 RepID=UPI00339CDE01